MKRSYFKRKATVPMKRTPLRKVSLKKVKKIKKPKKLTTTQLKKKLDEIFSKYIRRKYANSQGYVQCYTCPKTSRWEQMQNGHFISRSYLATRFLEDNVRPQCVGCNVFGNGRSVEFSKKLDSELGEGTTTRLYREAQKITKDFPYVEKIEHYTQKLKEINEIQI